jgi:hypothetical protein
MDTVRSCWSVHVECHQVIKTHVSIGVDRSIAAIGKSDPEGFQSWVTFAAEFHKTFIARTALGGRVNRFVCWVPTREWFEDSSSRVLCLFHIGLKCGPRFPSFLEDDVLVLLGRMVRPGGFEPTTKGL